MFPKETQEQIAEAQNYYCKNCLNKISSIHHKLHDTEYNRKRFPLFINSPMNGVGFCSECHMIKAHLFRITDKEAEMYENYLRRIKNDK